jgi:hypothetical protein
MTANLAALFRVAEPERIARLREFRLASLLLLGRDHGLTVALAAAIADPDALDTALAELDALAAIPRRRLWLRWRACCRHDDHASANAGELSAGIIDVGIWRTDYGT